MTKKGIAIGVGVGPGDPELITLKAVRAIRESNIIAVPCGNGCSSPEASVACQIALRAVPEMKRKTLVALSVPMLRDGGALACAHRKAAETMERYLDRGENVVYLTLGDPAVYSSFSYMQAILHADGYGTELVPGVTSFCAAAARHDIPLVTGNESLSILPAELTEDALFATPGNLVVMKSGRKIRDVIHQIRKSGRSVYAVENCGMENERLFTDADAIPEDAGYFTLMILKESNGCK